jgi:dienelactone hydrolase
MLEGAMMNRRSFFIILLVSVLAVASTAGAESLYVTYRVDDKPYEGYYTGQKRGAPLVLLVHDWDGLTDYEVKRSEMLAKLGYAVFAADLFGAGVRPEKVEERRKLTGALYKDHQKMRRLLFGALKAAKGWGADTANAVAVGYCFGGAAVLEFARAGAPLKAFVTFHGGLSIPEGEDYSKTRGQVLIFHGSADTSVTMDQFAATAKALEAAGVPHEMTTYGGAPHAFTVFGSDRYRADADAKSWARFTAFLKATLK